MPDIRLATFNCENLMMRCDFARSGLANARSRLTNVDDALIAEQVDAVFDVLSEDDRTLTAQALGYVMGDTTIARIAIVVSKDGAAMITLESLRLKDV